MKASNIFEYYTIRSIVQYMFNKPNNFKRNVLLLILPTKNIVSYLGVIDRAEDGAGLPIAAPGTAVNWVSSLWEPGSCSLQSFKSESLQVS